MSQQFAELGDVAVFVRGISFKPEDVVEIGTSGAVGCMRTKNVQIELDLSDVWGIPKSFVKRDDQYLIPGDVLVSSANSWNLVGKCCWVPTLPWPATFGGFVSVLRPSPDVVYPRYLFHWFSSNRIQTIVRSFGQQTTNISNLNIERCRRLSIPLPPLREQQRIAEVLDKAGTLRDKCHTALARLDTLMQSIFLDMFGDPGRNPKGWGKVKLEEALNIPLRNGLSPSNAGFIQGKILTLSAITGTEFDEMAQKVSTFQSTPSPDQTVDMNDFLICRGNGNIHLVGKGYFPLRTMPDVTFPDTMIAARVSSEKFERAFLQQAWNLPAVRQQIESMARTTNGTFKINQSMLGSVSIVNPPISLQRKFSDRVNAVERVRIAQRASLAKLDALFASLQHQVFFGEM